MEYVCKVSLNLEFEVGKRENFGIHFHLVIAYDKLRYHSTNGLIEMEFCCYPKENYNSQFFDSSCVILWVSISILNSI